jgi:hypothetical protein
MEWLGGPLKELGPRDQVPLKKKNVGKCKEVLLKLTKFSRKIALEISFH